MKTQAISLIFAIFFLTNVAAAHSLKGSPWALERQNEQADLDHLSRLTESQLEFFKKRGLLVPLPSNEAVVIDEQLPEQYRWCRPWVRQFLIGVGQEYQKRFGEPIRVNSAIRTVEYQKELRWRDANAASAEKGPSQSSHLTGATVDIAKKDMSSDERAWMRHYLIALKHRGRIEATEEFWQEVFHVMVFKPHSQSPSASLR